MNRTLNPCTRSVAGTNPIAFAAPATDGDSMILDMATTGSIQSCFCHKFRTVHLLKYMLSVLFLPLTPSYVPFFRDDSWSLRIMFIASMRSISPGTVGPEWKMFFWLAVAIGKIEMQKRKSQPIPDGWALDSDGNHTTDAAKAFAAGKLLPLGGDEKTSSYKGPLYTQCIQFRLTSHSSRPNGSGCESSHSVHSACCVCVCAHCSSWTRPFGRMRLHVNNQNIPYQNHVLLFVVVLVLFIRLCILHDLWIQIYIVIWSHMMTAFHLLRHSLVWTYFSFNCSVLVLHIQFPYLSFPTASLVLSHCLLRPFPLPSSSFPTAPSSFSTAFLVLSHFSLPSPFPTTLARHAFTPHRLWPLCRRRDADGHFGRCKLCHQRTQMVTGRNINGRSKSRPSVYRRRSGMLCAGLRESHDRPTWHFEEFANSEYTMQAFSTSSPLFHSKESHFLSGNFSNFSHSQVVVLERNREFQFMNSNPSPISAIP